MSQLQSVLPHGGWTPEETEHLWKEVRSTYQNGEPLRMAFDRMALRTGRKANSIRNFYYAALKTDSAPADLPTGRAIPFTPFSGDEIENLLRAVLTALGGVALAH